MENNQHNEELSEMAPVLGAIDKRELHKCPDGYFDDLALAVLNKIKESPVLNSVEKKELNEAPEKYFENLSNDVLARIHAAPVLLSLEKKELAQVPAGYFDDVATNTRVKGITKKIIPLHIRVWQWTAVAAGICLIIGGSYFMFGDWGNSGNKRVVAQQNATPEDYTNYLMNELPDEDLYAFVSENQAEEKDSTDAMMDYLIDESTDFDLENIE